MDLSSSQEALLIVLQKVMERGLEVELADGTVVHVRLAPEKSENDKPTEPAVDRRTW